MQSSPKFLSKPRKLPTLALVTGLALTSVGLTSPAFANSEVITVTEGSSISNAIRDIEAGGTVQIAPGTYIEELTISKPLQLVGSGPGVIIKQPATGNRKHVDILQTSGVSISNITFDGADRKLAVSAQTPGAYTSTGIDVNTAAQLTFTSVTVQNYNKNGISVTAQFAANHTPISRDIHFENVTATGNDWAGIVFYTLSSEDVSVDIEDLTFAGTTTVTGNGSGVQFGDPGDTHQSRGDNGGAVALGTVVFANNTEFDLYHADSSHVTIDGATSTVGGARASLANLNRGTRDTAGVHPDAQFSIIRPSVPLPVSSPPFSDTDEVLAWITANPDAATAFAQAFTLPLGSAPLNNYNSSAPFSGEVPWSADDDFVDLHTFSSPVTVGSFAVSDGTLSLNTVDLTHLPKGNHHLVFAGQTSGTFVALPITITSTTVPNNNTGQPGNGTLANSGSSQLSALMPIGLVIAVAGTVLTAVQARKRRSQK